MTLSLASEDSEDKILWQVYQDLSNMHLPIKEIEKDGTLIGDEICEKMEDIQDTWVWSKKGEAWGSKMVRIIAETRRQKKPIPIYDIDKSDLDVIKNEMEYFGITENDDLDYFSRFFVYDIFINLSTKYSIQEKFTKVYQKLYQLYKSGNYPATMDEPDEVIQKAIFIAIVKDLVKYFRK